MALTVEEKLARLNNLPDWEIYPPEKKEFLISIANGIDPDVAYARARPNKGNNPRHHASLWLRNKEIQRALEAIQYEKKEPIYGKREALEDITYRLRKANVEDETYIKLLGLLAKMNGWDKPKKVDEKEDKEVDPLDAVLERERKRRESQ